MEGNIHLFPLPLILMFFKAIITLRLRFFIFMYWWETTFFLIIGSNRATHMQWLYITLYSKPLKCQRGWLEEEQEWPGLSEDLSQRAGQETDGSGGCRGGEGWCTDIHSAWPQDITESLAHTHPLSSASQGINKPIMASAHMGKHRREVTWRGWFCFWLAILPPNDLGLRCCCRCHKPVTLLVTGGGKTDSGIGKIYFLAFWEHSICPKVISCCWKMNADDNVFVWCSSWNIS